MTHLDVLLNGSMGSGNINAPEDNLVQNQWDDHRNPRMRCLCQAT